MYATEVPYMEILNWVISLKFCLIIWKDFYFYTDSLLQDFVSFLNIRGKELIHKIYTVPKKGVMID